MLSCVLPIFPEEARLQIEIGRQGDPKDSWREETDSNLYTHTQRSFYTQKRFHPNAVTNRSSYTKKSLHGEFQHIDAFTHRNCYTEKPLHTEFVHTEAFTHKAVFLQTRFHTEKLSHTEAFTPRSFFNYTG